MSRLALALIGVGLTGTALANPTTMAHQGRLMDGFGVPIDGPHDLTFRLYNTQIGGAIEWSETLTDVPMSDGYFSVLLGNSSPLDGAVFDGSDQWLAIAVDSDPELSSRKRIAAVPYAARAASVDWSDIEGIPADIADGDDVLTEADVEGFVINDALDLAVGTTLDGVDIAALGNTDWSEITGVPGDLADGDDVLTEAAVEGFVTNAAIDLAAGTTLDGVDLGSLGNPDWGNITNVPADLADGDDQRSEAAVEGFITNGAINLHGSSTVGGASIAGLGNTAQWGSISGIPADISNGDQTLTESQVETYVTNGALDLAAGTSIDGVDISGLGNTASWTGLSGIPADIANGDQQRSEAAVEGFITNGAINLHGSSTVGGASIAGLGNTAQWGSISGIPADISNGDQTLSENQVETFVTNGPLDLAAGTSVDGVDISGLGNTASWTGLSGIPADIADGDQQRSEAAVEGFITNGAINLHGSSTVGGASIAGLGNTAQWGSISGIPASIADGDHQRSEATVESFITNGAINLHGGSTVGGASISGLGNTANWSGISGIPADIANGDNVLTSSQVRSYVAGSAINLHGSSTVGGASIAGLGNTAQWGSISGIPADIANGDQQRSEATVETFITNGAIDLASGSEVGGVDIAVITDPMVVSGVHNKSTANLIIYPTDPSATIVPGSMTTITPTQTGHKVYAMFNTNIRTQGDEGEYCQFSMRVSGGGYSSTEFSTASTGWVASAHQTMTVAGSVTVNTLDPLTVFVTVQALDGRSADPEVDPHICRVGDRTTNSMLIMELK